MLTFREFYEICEGKKPDTPPHAVPGTVNRDSSGTLTYTLQSYDGPKVKPSKKEIKKALLFSGSDKFINKLNKKMTTFVGERGTQLSGGQRQRLLLARSILRKPELLILDEAINSLDKNSRKTIMKKLRKISSKTTIIIISHDNLNIDKGDNIIRF